MKIKKPVGSMVLLAMSFVLGVGNVSAKKAATKVETTPLNAAGTKLEAQYATELKALQAEITKVLPVVSEQKKAAFQKAHAEATALQGKADAAKGTAAESGGTAGMISNWKKFWIGKANQGIAKAQADLKAATTDAARNAAKKDLEKWQANKADGEKHIADAQAKLDAAKSGQAALDKANKAAQDALAKARAAELAAINSILADLAPFLSSDKMDAKLAKCTVLTEATPHGFAEFAQESADKAALVEALLADDKLMKEMLYSGGAKFSKYGRAMEIYTAIQKASPKSASDATLHRLALATSLEHAMGIKQSNADDQKDAPQVIDPVKRYLHYEKAYLDGELDPAFKNLTTWEYRLVVDCDAPDQILTWGRQMLRNYRPDHIYSSNYGWRYSATVKTEVPYGSQNVKNDLPSLQSYQNIIKDGGVCGRRAFFGRFILRCFGIPVWGVTQHAHAALSHWTPKGWLVNLGAGYEWSWWDKDESSLSGRQFLLETQAREHEADYWKVVRAQCVSRILGEQAYNDRKKVDGGFWSSIGHYQSVAIASSAVELGPLGQELAEANEPEEKLKGESQAVSTADQQSSVKDGAIVIQAVAHGKVTGKFSDMKSFSGGMQMHGLGGSSADYTFDAPQAGKYALVAQVATVQEGQKFGFAINNTKDSVEVAVPYTLGMWKMTPPAEVTLVKGKNVLHFELKDGSRGVAIKEFILKPAK